MQDDLHIEDWSNDKAYFTMVPNIVLNHSSAVDQALYMQMKRFAGEKRGGGYCTASHRTLMNKLKIGPKALKTSIEYLVEHKWIENAGSRKVMTRGGAQEVQIYRVNDIWRMNVEHYKGADESVHLSEGGDERTKGADERSKGGDESAPTKNYIKHTNTFTEQSSDEEIIREEPEEPVKGSREVVLAFREVNPSYKVLLGRKTEHNAARRLIELHGLHRVLEVVRILPETNKIPYLPTITTPIQLESNWAKLEAGIIKQKKMSVPKVRGRGLA